MSGGAGTAGTTVAGALVAFGNCGCAGGAATSVNGIPGGGAGAFQVPDGVGGWFAAGGD